MKVISLNLHCHKEENEQEKLSMVAEYIKKNNIDVCLLQEVCQRLDGKEVLPGIKEDNNGYFLMKETGYTYIFRPFKIGFGIYDEGLGILSKLPMENIRLTNLTHTESEKDWFRRCALSCDIEGIHFIDVHLGWSLENEPYQDQIKRLSEEFGTKTILGGDFNYPDGTEEIGRIKKYLISSHDDFKILPEENPTFHNPLDSKLNADNRMIDFIFHSGDLKIKRYSIHFNEENTYVSDHSMVEIEL